MAPTRDARVSTDGQEWAEKFNGKEPWAGTSARDPVDNNLLEQVVAASPALGSGMLSPGRFDGANSSEKRGLPIPATRPQLAGRTCMGWVNRTRLTGVLLIVVAAAAGLCWWHKAAGSGAAPSEGNPTAAVSNLNTAFVGANTYYTDGNRSFVGVNGPVSGTDSTGTSDLAQVNTGLWYVAGDTPSRASHFISVFVPRNDHGQAIEMVSWGGPALSDCWGLLAIKARLPRSHALQGETRPGVYEYVMRKTTESECKARTARETAISATVEPTP